MHGQNNGLTDLPLQLGRHVLTRSVNTRLLPQVGGVGNALEEPGSTQLSTPHKLQSYNERRTSADLHRSRRKTTDPSSKVRNSAADPESLDMNIKVPIDPAFNKCCAVMIGPIVLVWRCFANSSNDLPELQYSWTVQIRSFRDTYISVAL